VPVGPDQVPLIELCREVVHRFNSQYGKRKRILTTPNALLGVREALQGIDGNAKMSKSLNNAIYLSETDAEIWAKVKPAPTDPQRVRREDPGRPELCNIYAYHKVFNQAKESQLDEQALGVASVEEVAENCRGAKWGCIECKQHLCKKLTAILDPMRERRAAWEKRPDDLADVLRAGANRANEEGAKTLERVRSAMHMDYFAPSAKQT
jgi:tryptophanyl-tRNA synthetase